MFRLWAKEFKSNRMIRDMVVENDSPEMSRTKKVFAALEEVCYEFDLSKPIWLEHGSLTLCLPLDFHNPLQHSPLRLIFLSNFKILLVIVCHCVV